MEQGSMGKRIMSLRKEKGYTQEQLAEKVSVSAQAVSKWENDVSCPDISILPLLADALGVTTDELLGVKPIEPKVVVVESQREKNGKKEGFSFSYNSEKKNGIWFGVMVVLVGLAFLMSRTNILPNTAGISFWGIVWPAVILGLGVSWFVHDWSPFALGVAVLGLYYLLYNLGAVSYVLSWNIVWPVLIILLGLSILVDKIWPNRKKCGAHFDENHQPVSNYSEAQGYIHYDCSFSEDDRRITNGEFAGADIDLSFGKSVLDLTQVTQVLPDAEIHADVSFGSLEILMPRTIHLVIDSDKAFGSIQVKGNANNDAPFSVKLNGDVSFGSLMVRYL